MGMSNTKANTPSAAQNATHRNAHTANSVPGCSDDGLFIQRMKLNMNGVAAKKTAKRQTA